MKITVYYTASVLCSSSTLSDTDFSPLPARVLENSMHIVTKSASTPVYIKICAVLTYDTKPLNIKETIGTVAILTAVLIDEVRARYSSFILFIEKTFMYELVNAAVYPKTPPNTEEKIYIKILFVYNALNAGSEI